VTVSYKFDNNLRIIFLMELSIRINRKRIHEHDRIAENDKFLIWTSVCSPHWVFDLS